MPGAPAFPFRRTVVCAALLKLLVAATVVAVDVWTAIGPSAGVSVLAADPGAPKTLYAGTAAGLFKTTDGGMTWSALTNGLPASFIDSLAIAPERPTTLFAGTAEGVFRSTEAGASWSLVGITGDNVFNPTVRHLAAESSLTVYAVLDAGIFKTTDGGAHWFAVNNGLTNLAIFSLAIDRSSPSALYAGGLGVLFKTTNGGASWSPLGVAQSGPTDYVLPLIESIAIHPTTPSTIYVGTSFRGPAPTTVIPSGSVLKSTDGGITWTEVTNGLPRSEGSWVRDIAIDRAAPTTVYATQEAFGVYKTTDAGSTWTASLMSPAGILEIGADRAVYATVSGRGVFVNTSAVTTACRSEPAALCLQGRFRVEVSWSANLGSSGAGQAMPLTSDTGAFWFFNSANLELMIKVLDGRVVNGRFWVFYGSLTNVEFTLTVTDTLTGSVKTYSNTQGQFASVADTAAF